MNTLSQSGHASGNETVSSTESATVPWLKLRVRIREALSRRNSYVASSEDLALLWRGERIDATERRRRITVFAVQHQWRVEARTDGTSARFEVSTPSGLREVLSRNPE